MPSQRCRYPAIANPQCFEEVVARCKVPYANPTGCSEAIESRPEEQLKIGRTHPLVRVVLHRLAVLLIEFNHFKASEGPLTRGPGNPESVSRSANLPANTAIFGGHATWLTASYIFYIICMYIYI